MTDLSVPVESGDTSYEDRVVEALRPQLPGFGGIGVGFIARTVLAVRDAEMERLRAELDAERLAHAGTQGERDAGDDFAEEVRRWLDVPDEPGWALAVRERIGLLRWLHAEQVWLRETERCKGCYEDAAALVDLNAEHERLRGLLRGMARRATELRRIHRAWVRDLVLDAVHILTEDPESAASAEPSDYGAPNSAERKAKVKEAFKDRPEGGWWK